VLYSFTSTCQRLGVEPWRYLRDVLERLASQRWHHESISSKTNTCRLVTVGVTVITVC
jgi:hypothetical protein